MDMKNDRIIKFLCCLFMVTQIIGCSDWIEAEPTILPEMKYKELTPEEEAALIAYKNSKHKIFFAWMNYHRIQVLSSFSSRSKIFIWPHCQQYFGTSVLLKKLHIFPILLIIHISRKE